MHPTPDLEYTIFDTPVGRLSVAYRGPTACYSDLDVDDAAFEAGCQRRLGIRPLRNAEPPTPLESAVRDFFEGSGRYQGPVDLTLLSDLQQRALRKVMELRRGKVRTYSWIAREIGAPNAARAVGTAVMTPPAKAGGFSEERLLAPTAASQATAQVSPCGHLSRLAPEGPIRALKRGTPCSPKD